MALRLALAVLALAVLPQAHCAFSFEDTYVNVYPSSEIEGRTPLFFSLVQSLGSENFDGSGAVAGVQVALDLINSNEALLPGYSLHYTLGNSSCDRTMALDAFFQQIIQDPVKIAFIGSGCSVATEPTAEISHYYNITHISCVSSSAELEDHDRFRYYYQLLPSEASITMAYYATVRQYNWRRVSIIVQNENLFTVVTEELKDLFTRDGIDYSERIFESSDGIDGLGDQPFDPDSRIHLFVTYAIFARRLLCEAYFRNISQPRHLFILPAWYVQEWWLLEDEGENLNCTALQRASVMPSTLGLLHFDFIRQLGDINTDSGITSFEYLEREKKKLGVPPLNLTELEYSQYCYDATWSLAYALDNTLRDLEDGGDFNELARNKSAVTGGADFNLENFTYNNDVILNRIVEHVSTREFAGVTGTIRFNEDGIRNTSTLRVFQYTNLKDNGDLDETEIAIVLPNGTFQYGDGHTNDTTWPFGIPYDGVPNKKIVGIHVALTVIVFILSTCGIVFAVGCIIFNFVFRKKKLIRLTSPNLNYLILAGAIILYIDLYFVVIPTTDPEATAVLCHIVPWLTAIGYSLCYGTIVTKMFRVYYIFINPSPSKMVTKDWMLALAVCCLLFVDFIILFTYTAVEGVQNNLNATELPNRENMDDISGELGMITNYCVYICTSVERDIFLGFLYGYKFILQIVTLFLAFATRKVKVKGLDDAKYIAGTIYVTSIVLAVVIVATYSTKDLINVYAALFCAGNWLGTTTILVLVFVTKMVSLYQDPGGEKIFDRTDPRKAAHMSNTITGGETVSNASDPEVLKKRVRELEAVVAQYKNGTASTDHATKGKSDLSPLKSPVPSSIGKGVFADVLDDSETGRTIWDTENHTNGHTIEESTKV